MKKSELLRFLTSLLQESDQPSNGQMLGSVYLDHEWTIRLRNIIQALKKEKVS